MRMPPDSLWQYCVSGEWKYCGPETAAIGANAGTPIRLVDLPNAVGIRFARMNRHTLAAMGINGRKMSAAKRAIQRQRDAEGMFADRLEFDTPEERIAKIDAGHLRAHAMGRMAQAGRWREARRRLRQLPDAWRRYCIATFNSSGLPKDPVYLLEHTAKVWSEAIA